MRWAQDNIITPDPAHRYAGEVLQAISVDSLDQFLRGLQGQGRPFEVTMGGLGALTWNVRGRDTKGEFLLQLPVALDRPGKNGLSRMRVPEWTFKNARKFVEQGLTRYLLPAEDLVRFPGPIRGARFAWPSGYRPITFRLGAAWADLFSDSGASVVRFGAETSARIVASFVAALAYHYDASREGGTTLADVLVNEGDFLAARGHDGCFSAKLTCARRLESGVNPSQFLLHLIQLVAFEDWPQGSGVLGLATPISNVGVAFAGLVQGTRERFIDLKKDPEEGDSLARSWIAAFGSSREGRAYGPWIRQFLEGHLGLEMFEDPRRPWSNLAELEARAELLRLQRGEAEASTFLDLVERLGEAMCVGERSVTNPQLQVNELDPQHLAQFFVQLGLPLETHQKLTVAFFSQWPFYSTSDLVARVPELRAHVAQLASFTFNALDAGEEGTLKAFDHLPRERPPRTLANPEIVGGIYIPSELAPKAIAILPTFEDYVDDVLHDLRFGYYAHRVSIGIEGHFSTHPELLSPHYGRWIATWGYEVWSQMMARGSLDASERFPWIEFGAGNGRLARDALDAVAERAAGDPRWRMFSERLDYRIYEISPSLREKQRATLGDRAQVCEGDARHPSGALHRDFPEGVKGLIVSNELPDAFGVHKVLLSREGEINAVLVVPRLVSTHLNELPREVSERCRTSDSQLRALLSWRHYPEDTFLSRNALGEVLTLAYQLDEPSRSDLLDSVRFEEALVPAWHVSSLQRVIELGAAEYAAALAREPSGVVQYVNVHADQYVRELGEVLTQGQVLTIDYGNTTDGLVRDARRGKYLFRAFSDEGLYQPRPNDPYSRPGGQDLTSDVNFTDLALAGVAAGFQIEYFGPERIVSGSELPALLSGSAHKPFAMLAGNTAFKVLVLGKNVSYAPRGPGLEGLPVFAAILPSTF